MARSPETRKGLFSVFAYLGGVAYMSLWSLQGDSIQRPGRDADVMSRVAGGGGRGVPDPLEQSQCQA